MRIIEILAYIWLVLLVIIFLLYIYGYISYETSAHLSSLLVSFWVFVTIFRERRMRQKEGAKRQDSKRGNNKE